MDTDSITILLSNLLSKTRVKRFYVVGRDELESLSVSDLPCAIIANTDISTGKGIHWCAFYCKKNPINSNRASINYFFDSYANTYQFYKFHPPFPVCQLNCKVLQSNNSNTCGVWACAWIYHMAQGMSINSFYSHYSNNLEKNDASLMKKYSKLIPIISDHGKKCLTCSTRISNKF
jgi:hypothetical protein